MEWKATISQIKRNPLSPLKYLHQYISTWNTYLSVLTKYLPRLMNTVWLAYQLDQVISKETSSMRENISQVLRGVYFTCGHQLLTMHIGSFVVMETQRLLHQKDENLSTPFFRVFTCKHMQITYCLRQYRLIEEFLNSIFLTNSQTKNRDQKDFYKTTGQKVKATQTFQSVY